MNNIFYLSTKIVYVSHEMILSYRYPISHKGGLLRQNINLTTITTLAEERPHWAATQPKFNPGLSQILSKIFLSTNMQLNLTKYCWAFASRYNNENTKCYSKQYIGRKNTKMAQNFNHGFALIFVYSHVNYIGTNFKNIKCKKNIRSITYFSLKWKYALSKQATPPGLNWGNKKQCPFSNGDDRTEGSL